MVRTDVKDELDSLQKDLVDTYSIADKRNLSYSKVIKCLIKIPAETLRTRGSGAQEVVTQVVYNGSIAHAAVMSNAR